MASVSAKKGRLTCVGLGFHAGQTTLESIAAMRAATRLYVAGKNITLLSAAVPNAQDLDVFRTNGQDRRFAYERMIERLPECVRRGEDVICARCRWRVVCRHCG